MKRVTCITTAYKNFDYIYQAIDSILAQGYPDIEMIICDDASDNVPLNDIIKYVEENKKSNITSIKIYSNEHNLGIVKNFNVAISKATGYYFIGLSSDDVFYSPNVISQIVEQFDSTKAKIATCKAIILSQNKNLDGRIFQTEKEIKMIRDLTPIELYNKIAVRNFILGASTFFTRELLDQYGAFQEDYVYIEDWSRYLRLSRENEKIHFFDVVSTLYRTGGISNSGNINIKYLADNMKICENEVLAYPEIISKFAVRYNLCRKEFLSNQINNIMTRKNILILLLKYPDVMLYRAFSKIIQKLERK